MISDPLQHKNNWSKGMFKRAGRANATDWLFKLFGKQTVIQAASLNQTTAMLLYNLLSIVFGFQNKPLFYFRLEYYSP